MPGTKKRTFTPWYCQPMEYEAGEHTAEDTRSCESLHYCTSSTKPKTLRHNSSSTRKHFSTKVRGFQKIQYKAAHTCYLEYLGTSLRVPPGKRHPTHAKTPTVNIIFPIVNRENCQQFVTLQHAIDNNKTSIRAQRHPLCLYGPTTRQGCPPWTKGAGVGPK